MPKRRDEGGNDNHDDIEPKPIKIYCEDKEKKVLVEIKNCPYGKRTRAVTPMTGKSYRRSNCIRNTELIVLRVAA